MDLNFEGGKNHVLMFGGDAVVLSSLDHVTCNLLGSK